MKRVVSILILAMFLNGCDDGDLIQEDINFENATAQKMSPIT
jgi:PBP1b-binding outer membrane lipoprotein LpoB